MSLASGRGRSARPAVLVVTAALAACARHHPQAPESRAEPAVARPAPPASAEAAQAPTTAPTAAARVAQGAGPWQPPPAQALAAMGVRQRVEAAVVPLDDVTQLHVRTVFREGAAAGQRADVFAKLGDSITESGSFVMDIGHGWYELGPWSRLEPVVQYFRRRSFSESAENNSFTRSSVAAEAGWTTATLLHDGDNSRMEQELAATRPAFAILMIGTNDAERSDVETYERNLNELVRRVEAHHVVLVLSTIPDQQSSPAAGALGLRINEVIRRVAWQRHLPLVDYWASMQGLPNHGLDPDNVHPSIYMADNHNVAAGVFHDRALAYGYNVRGLTTLLAFEQLMRLLDLHP